VPPGLAVDYVLGTRRFLLRRDAQQRQAASSSSSSSLLRSEEAMDVDLKKNSNNTTNNNNRDKEKNRQSGGDEMIVVDCTVNHRLGGGAGARRKEKRSFPQNHHLLVSKSRRRFLPPSLASSTQDERMPVQFSVFAARPGGGAVAGTGGATTTTTLLCLEALCSVLHGSLCVDGAMFHSSIESAAAQHDGPESPAWTSYRGPLLHQKHLAECVCSIHSAHPNPLEPYRQIHKHFFDPFVNPATSRFARYDHCPVHTVPAGVSDELVAFLEARGVDDHLAAYVEQFAGYVLNEEHMLWRRQLSEMGVVSHT
jgi:hypothetical protein